METTAIQTNKLQMTEGRIYHVKINVIKEPDGKKEVPTQSGTRYRYLIFGADKKGLSFSGEYLAMPESNPWEEFIEGVMQYVKCTRLSPRGTPTIEPCEEPGSITKMYSELKKTTTDLKKEALPYQPNCYSAQVSGTAICFSMAYAKDLKVAEIAKRESGEVTDQDIEDVCRWAHTINDRMCDRINFGQ